MNENYCKKVLNRNAKCVILQCEIISKMYLIENKEVTLLYKLNR